MISAIILAAGLSSRMGMPKQLLKLGGKTMVRIVTENVLASKVDEVLVVTGHREQEIRAEIGQLPVKILFNPNYVQGQGTSLALGAGAINDGTTAFLVFMADQPLITASLINMVIDEFKKRNCLALRPVYQGKPGHPVILDRALRAEAVELKGDEGLRKVLQQLGSRVEYLPVQDEAAIFDIDTPETYEKFISQYKI
ncbi:MAG TPA: molybdenum cofactor cytidylyltransferase [Bacillota bacterium]|mgnify:CR=1 FL=1|jgi:molybdenum cofactor cytidylyltransferase|nr:molybdenum cofactor cytidylyltransferase [Peptococcaceae bacterium MAG4]NLW39050.1 molybdenum cofactor cytidylyltransferase [Peptococcaceae bacterium]HPZ43141.1 molybdenum cofactor cytidylyltransferase [Bacillota bacterium]HQD75879.1 molybdenum cofactor cytidylyltransferase [Bacillota bacterium]HUM58392.1 molybdenum cofactor cytidylyltransferase [Bacillota bacterium]